jgi:hypothetical protein
LSSKEREQLEGVIDGLRIDVRLWILNLAREGQIAWNEKSWYIKQGWRANRDHKYDGVEE